MPPARYGREGNRHRFGAGSAWGSTEGSSHEGYSGGLCVLRGFLRIGELLMLVKLIKPIQTGVTALCLGKVSYPVFRAIYIIPPHELRTNLIFHRIRDILKQ